MKEEQWQAIVDCDAGYDERFYYGVITTGIFCRPSCRSRTPERKNVRIFSSPLEAREDGFRPCKRCRPEMPASPAAMGAAIGEVARLIEDHYPEDLTLRGIAARVFVSPFHLQRVFKEATGVSPNRYLTRRRIEAAKELLAGSDLSVTAIAMRVGFRSPSRFAAVFRREVGCRATKYRHCAVHPPSRETIEPVMKEDSSAAR